jgi:hypothetical protein
MEALLHGGASAWMLDDITGTSSMRHFGGETLKGGLRRIVNNLLPAESPRLRVNHPQ